MPQHVSFVIGFPEEFRPTVTLYEDGTYNEHRSFLKAKRATVCLYRHSSTSPSRIQLDLAERFAAAALYGNPLCSLEYAPSTSPWTYEWATQLGDDFAFGLAGGKELKWGTKKTGPLRKRPKSKFTAKERE